MRPVTVLANGNVFYERDLSIVTSQLRQYFYTQNVTSQWKDPFRKHVRCLPHCPLLFHREFFWKWKCFGRLNAQIIYIDDWWHSLIIRNWSNTNYEVYILPTVDVTFSSQIVTFSSRHFVWSHFIFSAHRWRRTGSTEFTCPERRCSLPTTRRREACSGPACLRKAATSSFQQRRTLTKWATSCWGYTPARRQVPGAIFKSLVIV